MGMSLMSVFITVMGKMRLLGSSANTYCTLRDCISSTFLHFIFAQILTAFCLILLSTNKVLSDPSYFLKS